MKKVTGHIAILLLAVFTFTLIPKDWYHACDRHLVEDLETEQYKYDQCSICDFHISLYTGTDVSLSFVEIDYLVNKLESAYQVNFKSSTYLFSISRGPPTV